MVKTHVSVSSAVSAEDSGLMRRKDASEVARKPGVISVCTIYE